MATATASMLPPASGSLELVVELIWQHSLNHLQKTKNEILLPADINSLIGGASVEIIKERLGNLLNTPVVAFEDNVNNVYRIMPTPAYDGRVGHAALAGMFPMMAGNDGAQIRRSPSVNENSKAHRAKAQKIPRPPNAFILYRQHHHPLIKADHPDYHNNDISVLLGKKWKEEAVETKAHFKALADEIKKKHAEDHPNYQYAPRKPSEKKRRCTSRRDTSSVSKSVLADNASSEAAPQSNSSGIPQNDIYTATHSPTDSANVPVNTNNHFEAMLANQSSQYVMGFEEGNFLTFNRRRNSPVSLPNTNMLPSIASTNAQQFSLPQSNEPIIDQPDAQSAIDQALSEEWTDLDFDLDDYFIEDAQ